MDLTMIFRGCLTNFPIPVAKFSRERVAPYRNIARLFRECDVRAMLSNPDFDFPDDVFINEHQLIKALGAMKDYKVQLCLPKPEWLKF